MRDWNVVVIPFFGRQRLRDMHLNPKKEIALPAATELGQSFSAKAQHLIGVRTRADGHGDLAVEGIYDRLRALNRKDRRRPC